MAVAGEDRDDWDVGDVAVVSGEFRNSSGSLADPTTVTVQVKTPDGTVTLYTYAGGAVTKDSTGLYHKNVTITAEGKWTLGMLGTGNVASAEHSTITVRQDPFA